MKKGREITIKVIKSEYVNNRRLAEFFAKKYTEDSKNKLKEKS